MTATESPVLHDFEGEAVHRATVAITGAGDGLSESLSIAPEEIELGDERFYLLRSTCKRVAYETDKNGVRSRVHTMKASTIRPVDPDLAEKMLSEHAAEVERLKAERDGQLALDLERAAEERERADLAATGSARATNTAE